MSTEWDIHHALEFQWLQEPAVIGGNRLHLVACEVMPDGWRINDPTGYWASPSIDFLLIGDDGVLWIGELKNRRDSPRDSWNAFCQVTYSEYLFHKNSFSEIIIPDILRNYAANLAKRNIALPAKERCLPKFSGQIRCMVIAVSMKHWCAMVSKVSNFDFGAIKQYLRSLYGSGSQANLAMKRFCTMYLPNDTVFTIPTLCLLTESRLVGVQC